MKSRCGLRNHSRFETLAPESGRFAAGARTPPPHYEINTAVDMSPSNKTETRGTGNGERRRGTPSIQHSIPDPAAHQEAPGLWLRRFALGGEGNLDRLSALGIHLGLRLADGEGATVHGEGE
eukprot:4446485-Prorocentrum_lima.AAC.1